MDHPGVANPPNVPTSLSSQHLSPTRQSEGIYRVIHILCSRMSTRRSSGSVMRYLFTTLPGISHLLPLIPFARAAAAAGHEVRIACAGTALPAAVAAGFPAIAIDDESTKPYEEIVRRISETEMTRELPPAELHAQFAAAFGATGNLMIDGLVAGIREWYADAVVYTPMAVAGLVAARATGATAIMHGLGTRWPTYGPALAHLRDVSRELGVEHCDEADIEIDVSPPSLERIHSRTTPAPTETFAEVVHPMRYLPYNGGGELPGWVRESPSRPRIVATLGSMSASYGDGTLLRHIIEASADLDVELVLMTGGNAPPDPLPDHVRSVPWVPLRAAMDNCSAVVHHGGSGTTYAALDAGVPQLAIPDRGTDSDTTASVIAARGAGLRLDPDKVTAATVAQLLGELLDPDGCRIACAEVARELHDMPAPSTVLDRVTATVRANRATTRTGA
ncbi:nucleotide disphospho-sugar-binding domain-containing protein [Nocardia halotolerans]|uniref:Nucleotide disphospho-sugar-binding domain-containing protein n=1 Tax=Nocardia halotolerans TaxID=1755878 RepID=A0ABV8VGK3_9NOCA